MAFTKLPITAYTPFTDGSSLTGVGITMADQWRLTTSFTGDALPIASNLERNDVQFSGIGSAMTESSGIFTFPSTGIYLVKFVIMINLYSGDSESNFYIMGTTNNSSYGTIAQNSTGESGGAYQNCYLETIVDVTDVANVKVRFDVNVANASSNPHGNTGHNRTCMTFIRLGDT
tara:strand:+ start:75 stop:596 length:522 start_codon:yes stop_codon:yes gene_type:complete